MNKVNTKSFEDNLKYIDSLRRSNLNIVQLKSFKDELEKIESFTVKDKSIFFDCLFETQYIKDTVKHYSSELKMTVDSEPVDDFLYSDSLDDRVKSKIIDSFVRENQMYIKYLINHECLLNI